MAELKPCPFCGLNAPRFIRTEEHGTSWHYVWCRGCGIRSSAREDQYSASLDWNLRADNPRIASLISERDAAKAEAAYLLGAARVIGQQRWKAMKKMRGADNPRIVELTTERDEAKAEIARLTEVLKVATRFMPTEEFEIW